MKKYFLIMIFTLLSFSCKNNKSELDKINELSGIYIPYNSLVLIYNDNLEIDLSFKIKIKKNELEVFLKTNQFKKIDTLMKNPNADWLFVNSVRKSFIPVEKIYGKNLQIFKNKKSIMIINYETSELWGLVSK